ncbi:MAG: ArsR/SmtB-type metalloregulator TsoR [Thermodesulfobacteriota bacterium]
MQWLAERASRLAVMAKGLADENRLRIFLCVALGPKSVSRVVEEVALSQPLVSHHLKELRRSGLVKVERKGPFVYYQAAGPQVTQVLAALAELDRQRDQTYT